MLKSACLPTRSFLTKSLDITYLCRTPCPRRALQCRRPAVASFASLAKPRPKKDQAENPHALPARKAEESIILRPYQQECLDAVLEAFREGRRKVGVSLATGSGKTVIFTELIHLTPPPPSNPDAMQTLILVHRRELVEQAARHCTRRYPEKSLEIEMGNMHASGLADITIASVQSINSKGRLGKYDPKRFKLVLVDEAHHVVAAGYLRVLSHFGLVDPKRGGKEGTEELEDEDQGVSGEAKGEQHGAEKHNAHDSGMDVPALVGVSATFSRHDGVALGKVIDHIVYHKDYVNMIEDEWLSNVLFTTVKTNADLSKVQKASTGDFQTSSLSKAINTPDLNEVAIRSWLSLAKDRRSTLVFCVDIQHLVDLVATFRRYGADARFVTGSTKDTDRASTIEAFKQGEFPVLLNCGVFTEGTDIPNIDCVMMCRPTRSRNLLVQMIGRGVRRFPGKKNCHVIDFVSSLEEGIVTTPTLYGLDPDEVVKEASVAQMQERKRTKDADMQQAIEAKMMLGQQNSSDGDIRVNFTDYESVVDLMADTSSERSIRALSKYAWVAISGSKFVLTGGPDGSYLVIDTKPVNGWKLSRTHYGEVVVEKPRYFVKAVLSSKGLGLSTGSPLLRPRQKAATTTFESAVHAADTYAATHFVQTFINLRGPTARWRDADATQAQVDFINVRCGIPEDQKLRPDSLSKGQASDMLTKLKHGVITSWKNIKAARQRRERELSKINRLKEWQAKETVQVGPLFEQTVGENPSMSAVT